MYGWPFKWMLVVVFVTCLVAGPTGWAAEKGRKVAAVSWPELKAAGKLGAGEMVEVEADQAGPVLRIENSGPAEQSYRLTVIDKPGVSTAQYALRGQVRYANVQGEGYLEMWSCFLGGNKYYSRTLDERGPTAKFSGSSDWRRFALPFFISEGKKERPESLEVNVILPGRGLVELKAMELVEYDTREAAMADSSTEQTGWWNGSTAGLIGGLGGSLVGLMGALIGWFASRGRARSVVMGLLKALGIIGVAALVGGGLALINGQPYAVYYPLLLLGGLCTVLPWAIAGRIRQQYEAQELRKMDVIDTVST